MVDFCADANLSNCSLVLHPDEIRLKICGKFMLAGLPGREVDLLRGMIVLNKDGQAIGQVAALAVYTSTDVVQFIILGRLPHLTGYLAIQPSQVEKVERQTVWLKIDRDEAASLPVCEMG